MAVERRSPDAAHSGWRGFGSRTSCRASRTATAAVACGPNVDSIVVAAGAERRRSTNRPGAVAVFTWPEITFTIPTVRWIRVARRRIQRRAAPEVAGKSRQRQELAVLRDREQPFRRSIAGDELILTAGGGRRHGQRLQQRPARTVFVEENRIAGTRQAGTPLPTRYTAMLPCENGAALTTCANS